MRAFAALLQLGCVACSTYTLRFVGAPTDFIVAAHSGAYGPQPFAEQTLSGEMVIDAYIGAVAQDLAYVGLSVDDIHTMCHPLSRMTSAQVQGKIVLVAAPNLIACTLNQHEDPYFVELAALGAKGIVLILPDYGTRAVCALSFGGQWSTFGPNVPSPKLPVFCTNLGKDFVTQVVVAYAIAKQLAPFVQPGFWHLPNGNTSAPLVVADVDLRHDPVPIDGVRSDGVYYGFFVPNAIYASLLFGYACYLLGLTYRDRLYAVHFYLPLVLISEGMLATGVRVGRFVLSPCAFSPRFMAQPGMPWERFFKTFPHVPSATSTLIVSLEYFKTVMGNAMSPTTLFAFSLAEWPLAAALFFIPTGFLVNLMGIMQRVTDKAVAALNEGRASDEDAKALSEYEDTLRVCLIILAVTLLCAVCVFFVSACICLYKLFTVAGESHSDVLQTSAVSMLKFVVVQFVFSIPMLIDLYQQSTKASIEMHDNSAGWYEYEIFAAACAQVVATAQVLQIGMQIRRLRAYCEAKPPLVVANSYQTSDPSARGSLVSLRRFASQPSTFFQRPLAEGEQSSFFRDPPRTGSPRAAAVELSTAPLTVRSVPFVASNI